MACHLFLQGCKSRGKALSSDLAVRLLDILHLQGQWTHEEMVFVLNVCDFLLFSHEALQLNESWEQHLNFSSVSYEITSEGFWWASMEMGGVCFLFTLTYLWISPLYGNFFILLLLLLSPWGSGIYPTLFWCIPSWRKSWAGRKCAIGRADDT